MKHQVICETCDRVIMTTGSVDDLERALLLAHFDRDRHPYPHRMRVEPMTEGRVEVTVTCKHHKCRNVTKSTKVPENWVNAVLIMFHSDHENHPLEVTIDGEPFPNWDEES